MTNCTHLVLGVTNGLCEHSRACRALRFFCEHEQKSKNYFASLRATQKFGEHEQASTRLNFASKSSKGEILRADKKINGPFITPSIQDDRNTRFPSTTNYKNNNIIKRFYIENSPLDGTVQSGQSAIM